MHYSRFLVSTPRRLEAGSPAMVPTKSMAEARTREENESFMLGRKVGGDGACGRVGFGRGGSVWADVQWRKGGEGKGLRWGGTI